MKKLILANGVELECLMVYEGPISVQGKNCRMLNAYFDPQCISYEALKAAVADEVDLMTLQYVNDAAEGPQGVFTATDTFEYYAVLLSIGEVDSLLAEGSQRFETERLYKICLCQVPEADRRIAALLDQLDAVRQALAELAPGLPEGAAERLAAVLEWQTVR